MKELPASLWITVDTCGRAGRIFIQIAHPAVACKKVLPECCLRRYSFRSRAMWYLENGAVIHPDADALSRLTREFIALRSASGKSTAPVRQGGTLASRC